MISHSGKVPGRPPEMGSAMADATELFVEYDSGLQGFLDTENIWAKRQSRRRPGGPTHTLGVGPALAAPRPHVAAMLPHFNSVQVCCFGMVKIGTSVFESSNSENFPCVTFLKQKTAENRTG